MNAQHQIRERHYCCAPVVSFNTNTTSTSNIFNGKRKKNKFNREKLKYKYHVVPATTTISKNIHWIKTNSGSNKNKHVSNKYFPIWNFPCARHQKEMKKEPLRAVSINQILLIHILSCLFNLIFFSSSPRPFSRSQYIFMWIFTYTRRIYTTEHCVLYQNIMGHQLIFKCKRRWCAFETKRNEK